MSSERFDLSHRTFTVVGAAATAHVDYTVPIGYVMKIAHGVLSHNCGDGARTVYWVLTRATVEYVLGEPVSVAANIRRNMYTDVIMPEALVLRYGDTISVFATGAPDAGKSLSMQLTVEERMGETG